MKQLIKNIAASAGIVSFMLVGSATFAIATPQTTHAAGCATGVSIFPAWYDGLCENDTSGNAKIKSPSDLSRDKSGTGIGTFVTIIALNIVNMLLYVVGYVSLGFIIFGGFKYMTSGDSSNGTSAAKTTILNAVIGMILAIMSVGIVKFITERIG